MSQSDDYVHEILRDLKTEVGHLADRMDRIIKVLGPEKYNGTVLPLPDDQPSQEC